MTKLPIYSMDSWQSDPVYNKLQDIKRNYDHPLFEEIKGQDLKRYLKSKIRAKQFEVSRGQTTRKEWLRLHQGTIDYVLYELLGELRIINPEHELSIQVNQQIEKAQEFLRTYK